MFVCVMGMSRRVLAPLPWLPLACHPGQSYGTIAKCSGELAAAPCGHRSQSEGLGPLVSFQPHKVPAISLVSGAKFFIQAKGYTACEEPFLWEC